MSAAHVFGARSGIEGDDEPWGAWDSARIDPVLVILTQLYIKRRHQKRYQKRAVVADNDNNTENASDSSNYDKMPMLYYIILSIDYIY